MPADFRYESIVGADTHNAELVMHVQSPQIVMLKLSTNAIIVRQPQLPLNFPFDAAPSRGELKVISKQSIQPRSAWAIFN